MTKDAIIILNGYNVQDIEYYRNNINKNLDIYCSDGGANLAFEIGIIPKMILGDLDSITLKNLNYYKTKNVEIIKYPQDKNYTDTELLVEKINNKYKSIFLIGAIGKRLDHSIANFNLLKKYSNLIIDTKLEQVKIIENTEELINHKGKIISLISAGEITKKIKLTGFKYLLNLEDLSEIESRGISNVVTSDKSIINIKEGKLILIINK